MKRHITTVLFLMLVLLVQPALAAPPVFNGNINSKGWPSFSLRWYAACAGEDDTTALQQAFTDASASAQGAVVDLAGCAVNLTGQITITGTRIKVLGNGSIIYVNAPYSGDLFHGRTTQGAQDSIEFDGVKISYIHAQASGATFDFPYTTNLYLKNIETFGTLYNFIQWSADTTTSFNNVWIDNANVGTVSNDFFKSMGSAGGIYVTNSYIFGSGNAGASRVYSFDNTSMTNATAIDTFWFQGDDFESMGGGIVVNVNKGGFTDGFFSNNICDGPDAPCFSFNATGTGSVTRLKFLNDWSTINGSAANDDDFVATQSSGGTVKDLQITGGNYQGGGVGSCFNIGSGVAGIDIHGVQCYNSGQYGINAQGTKINIAGSTIGGPYNGNNAGGIYIAPSASYVNVASSDLKNNTNWAVNVASGASNVAITGNDVNGYANPIPIGATASNVLEAHNLGAPNYYLPPLGTATSGGNFASPAICQQNSIWNGSSAVTHNWCWLAGNGNGDLLQYDGQNEILVYPNGFVLAPSGPIAGTGTNACSSSSGTPCGTTGSCSLTAATSCTFTASVPTSAKCTAQGNASDTTTGAEWFKTSLSTSTLTVTANVAGSQTSTAAANVTCL